MRTRGQRALHPHLVARTDLTDTAPFQAVEPAEPVPPAGPRESPPSGSPGSIDLARHRRPTRRLSPYEIEWAAAESAPPPARSRVARGSSQPDLPLPRPVDWALEDELAGPARLLSFRARHPWIATALTVALVVASLLVLYAAT